MAVLQTELFDRTADALFAESGSIWTPLSRNRQTLRILAYGVLVLCDAATTHAAFSLAQWFHGENWLRPQGIDLAWLIVLLQVMIGLREGAYTYQAIESRIESVRRSWRSLTLAVALVGLVIFFTATSHEVSRLGFGLAIAFAFLMTAMVRLLAVTLLVIRGRNWMFGHLLILDGGEMTKGLGCDFIDARAMKLSPDINDPAQLSRLAEEMRHYDRVVVSCATEQVRSEWAQVLKCFGVLGEIVLDGDTPLGAIGLDRFGGRDTIIVSRGALSLGNRVKKRLVDVVVSSIALVLLAPLLVAVAVAIKRDSKGPIFFAQPRVGRANRMFNILKFRSMAVESSDLAGSRSAARDDDRITRVGRFIRATSIDELPQLINVLIGDMSIVGPRPHALGSLAEERLFWEIDNNYWQRHALKPGITGLAQVRGFRGATLYQSDLQNRLQSDLEYISGWSLWRDMKILVSTVRVIVHPNAY